MREANKVIKNTGFLYMKMGITMFISLYTTRLIINALGAEDFGIFNIVGGAIAMLGFLNAAMATATQRFMSFAKGENNPEKLKSIFNISVVLHLVIALIAGVLLIIAGYFFFNGLLNISVERMAAARFVFYCMIASTMLTIITVPYDAVLNAHENMLYYSIVGIIESILKMGVALIVVYTTFDKLIVYGALMASISIFILLIMRFYCNRKYSECTFEPKKYYNITLLKEMTVFAGWNFLATSVSMIGFYGQGIVINMFFGTIVNAAQGIANQVNGQLSATTSSLQKALNPVIIKKEGVGDRKSMIEATYIGGKVSYFLLLFCSIPVIVDMDNILRIWIKEVPDFAVIFCQLTLVRSLIEQLFITLSTAISAIGKIKRIKIVASVSSLTSLIIVYILFRAGNPPKVMYYVFIVNQLVVSFYVLWDASIKCEFSIMSFVEKILFKALIVTTFSLGYCYLNHLYFNRNWVEVLLYLICYGILFLGVVFFLGLSPQERSQIKSLIINIRSKKLFIRS